MGQKVSFVVSLLVLITKMKTQGQPKISLLCFGVNQENLRDQRVKIPLCNPNAGKILLRASASYNKLLGIAEFRTLPNIYHGSSPRKQSTVLRH